MKTRTLLCSITLALPFTIPGSFAEQDQNATENATSARIHDLILTIGERSADIDEIIGTKALSVTGETVGEVVDAVFDKSTGQAIHLVVSEDDLFDDKRALIPIAALTSEELPLSTEENQINVWDGMELRLATTEEQFSDLAVLDENMSIKQYLANQGPTLQRFFAAKDVEGRSPDYVDPDNLVFSQQLPAESHSKRHSRNRTEFRSELVTNSSGWETMKVNVNDREIEAQWLVGVKVVDRDGNTVGEVIDLAEGQSDSQSPQIVVSTDDWLDGRVALINPSKASYHDGNASPEGSANLLAGRQNLLVLDLAEAEFDQQAQFEISQNQLKPISEKPQS